MIELIISDKIKIIFIVCCEISWILIVSLKSKLNGVDFLWSGKIVKYFKNFFIICLNGYGIYYFLNDYRIR